MGASGGGWRFWRVGPLVAATLGLLAGCGGGGGPDRVPLGGTVQVHGEPLASGSISLLPAKGQSGPAVTASITAGRYQFTREDGPTAGPHRAIVQLTAADKGAMLAEASRRGPRPKTPAKTRWELEVDVPAGEPANYDVKLE